MPVWILSFLMKYWKGIALFLIVFSAFTYVYFYLHNLHSTIEDQKKEIGSLTTQLEDCRGDKLKLESSVAEQNRSIETLKQRSDKATEEIKKATTTATQIGNAYNNVISDITKRPKPQGCEKTHEYLKDSSDLKWELNTK